MRSTERKADDLLKKLGITSPPVPVLDIARSLGLDIEAANLGPDVSGVLVIRDGSGTIGFNKDQPIVRQRFSIAHEIGHFVLHHKTKQLFIDRKNTAVFERNLESASGDRLVEIQANQFAAALLMPDSMLRTAISTISEDVDDDLAVRILADKFDVSAHAMYLRLHRLGFLSEGPSSVFG